jgi:hypothetical protein
LDAHFEVVGLHRPRHAAIVTTAMRRPQCHIQAVLTTMGVDNLLLNMAGQTQDRHTLTLTDTRQTHTYTDRHKTDAHLHWPRRRQGPRAACCPMAAVQLPPRDSPAASPPRGMRSTAPEAACGISMVSATIMCVHPSGWEEDTDIKQPHAHIKQPHTYLRIESHRVKVYACLHHESSLQNKVHDSDRQTLAHLPTHTSGDTFQSSVHAAGDIAMASQDTHET